MQDARVKWNPGPSFDKQHSTRRRRCPPVNWIQIKETACVILHLERSFKWCWNWDTSESRSQIFCKHVAVIHSVHCD